MDIQFRCGAQKERVRAELQEAAGTWERDEILIAALYELSRSVLSELGRPVQSPEYLDRQLAVLELISFIAISLIRNCTGDTRGVAVLTEIGEGCHDPVLKKKLSVYAQELLVKSRSGVQNKPRGSRRRIAWLLGAGAASILALFLSLPEPPHPLRERKAPPETAPASLTATPLSYQAAAPESAPAESAPAVAATGRERNEAPPAPQVQAAPEGKGAQPAEQSTKVRIANNQVLVPVVLKNGGETVRVELMLDTGSTRTSIHEGLAGRLRIDLRQAKQTQSEVADGRIIRSRSTVIEALGVGPFSMTSAEVDLIPYKGTEGFHDGLLGMDFLGRHRYQIDMEHELIRWF